MPYSVKELAGDGWVGVWKRGGGGGGGGGARQEARRRRERGGGGGRAIALVKLPSKTSLPVEDRKRKNRKTERVSISW